MSRTLVWHLALRYLRGKRTGNAVPILSRISMAAIAVGSCAMIVLFSVFNGFEHLVKDLYKAFYPEVKISADRGKFFSISPDKIAAIKAVKTVDQLSFVLEDNVLVNSETEQRVATLKGVDKNYMQVNDVEPYIIDGSDSIVAEPVPTAIIGMHIANQMGADVNNVFSKLVLYYPNADGGNFSLDPQAAFQSVQLKPDGVFRVQDEFDGKYILAALPVVQSLLKAEGKYSSIELKLANGGNAEKVQRQLQQILGASYKVETRFEQNRTLYMVMRTEKWAVYAILLLVLMIASFNMVGALSLLVLEKQKDIAILKTMGAQPTAVKAIFITEGILWALTGGFIGLVTGALLCLGQQHFQWIKLGGSFIIEAYPVSIQLPDMLLIIATIIVVGILAAWYPAMRAVKAEDPSLKGAA